MKTSLTLLSLIVALSAGAEEDSFEARLMTVARAAFESGASSGILFSTTNQNPNFYTNLDGIYESLWAYFKRRQAQMRSTNSIAIQQSAISTNNTVWITNTVTTNKTALQQLIERSNRRKAEAEKKQAEREAWVVEWQFDAVSYSTNHFAYDEERNKTNNVGGSDYSYYVKTVVRTNKASSCGFRFGDRDVELGAREDGVIVWRNAK